MVNGVPVGMVDKFKRHKGNQVYPLIGESEQIEDEIKAIQAEMDKDPSFDPDMVLVPGVGLVNKHEWQQQQS